MAQINLSENESGGNVRTIHIVKTNQFISMDITDWMVVDVIKKICKDILKVPEERFLDFELYYMNEDKNCSFKKYRPKLYDCFFVPDNVC